MDYLNLTQEDRKKLRQEWLSMYSTEEVLSNLSSSEILSNFSPDQITENLNADKLSVLAKMLNSTIQVKE